MSLGKGCLVTFQPLYCRLNRGRVADEPDPLVTSQDQMLDGLLRTPEVVQDHGVASMLRRPIQEDACAPRRRSGSM